MRLFLSLYDKILTWSRHRHAPRYLAALSFGESTFFPIPPDFMLMPMVLANPAKAWWFALLTTVCSVLGGILGYFIGYFAFAAIGEPIIFALGYTESHIRLIAWFNDWGFWVIFLAGFSPIPFKIFTITSGALDMNLSVFIIAATLSRGARFFLVSGLIRFFGPQLEHQLRQYINCIGWLMVLVFALLLAYFYF